MARYELRINHPTQQDQTVTLRSFGPIETRTQALAFARVYAVSYREPVTITESDGSFVARCWPSGRIDQP